MLEQQPLDTTMTPRKLLPIAAAILALLLPAALPATAGEAEVYGAGVDLEKATRIADILADPNAYIGKTVRVDGGVIDVCSRQGCWIQVGDEPYRIIRIKGTGARIE